MNIKHYKFLDNALIGFLSGALLAIIVVAFAVVSITSCSSASTDNHEDLVSQGWHEVTESFIHNCTSCGQKEGFLVKRTDDGKVFMRVIIIQQGYCPGAHGGLWSNSLLVSGKECL